MFWNGSGIARKSCVCTLWLSRNLKAAGEAHCRLHQLGAFGACSRGTGILLLAARVHAFISILFAISSYLFYLELVYTERDAKGEKNSEVFFQFGCSSVLLSMPKKSLRFIVRWLNWSYLCLLMVNSSGGSFSCRWSAFPLVLAFLLCRWIECWNQGDLYHEAVGHAGIGSYLCFNKIYLVFYVASSYCFNCFK